MNSSQGGVPITYESLPRFFIWDQGGVNLGLPRGHAGGTDGGQSWEGPGDLRGLGMTGEGGRISPQEAAGVPTGW